MRKLNTEVLVIGGGATGTGVARDLAIRGFRTVLVEKRDLSHGTTGRYHGLLHSGGRYVVKDPKAARECIIENRILRRIMPQCIEDTGGFFVLTPDDDPEYPHFFLAGCRAAGIPVEEITTSQMLREEPSLNPKISRCFRVPDAAADSFLASEINAESAREHGAQILTYHPLVNLLKSGDRVIGAICHDLISDEPVQIEADMIVNAAGAWAGKVAGLAGISVRIRPGKGTMVALNHRFLNTILNRCKMPSDGDIIVPIHTVSVIGTTDIPITDPDSVAIEPWEVRLMLEEGEKMVPGLKDMRILRAWAGTRPLYQESSPADSRAISRAYALLDHESRDGISGFLTITSGKWTTYRLMAQETADLVCEKLGVDRPCRTQDEALPGARDAQFHRIGDRLSIIERSENFGTLFCECELVTRDNLIKAILKRDVQTLDDLRRDTRLGMGPCQGGFCTYRAAGLIHYLHRASVEGANLALRDFLEERWKGLLPVLWGAQLRQERLTEFIFVNLFNLDRLPGAEQSRLAAEPYDWSTDDRADLGTPGPQVEAHTVQSPTSMPTSHDLSYEWVVIGGGLSGLYAAWLLTKKGINTALITKGWGRTHWHTGCIDILGYAPPEYEGPVTELSSALKELLEKNPLHPYFMAGWSIIEEAIEEFKTFCLENNFPFEGSLARNWLLPTAVGAVRPSCLAPRTMIAGDLRDKEPMLIVGFEGFADFYSGLIADNLMAQGFPASDVTLDLPSFSSHKLTTPVHVARLFEEEEFRNEVINALRGKLGTAHRVGFPAIMGTEHTQSIVEDFETKLGCRVFEIPSLPPSIAGIRLHNLLERAIVKNGGRVMSGMQVVHSDFSDGRIHTISSEAAARPLIHKAENFILATGGILGGGLVARQDGGILETVFKLPCIKPAIMRDWYNHGFLQRSGQGIFMSGIVVNADFKPIDPVDRVVFDNLYATGTTLAGGDYLREASMEGVDLVSAYRIVRSIAG